MAHAWLNQIWPIVDKHRFAKRKAETVWKCSTETDLIREARRRGFHVALVGANYLIFRDAIQVKC